MIEELTPFKCDRHGWFSYYNSCRACLCERKEPTMSKEKTREIKGWVREYHVSLKKEGVAMPFFPEKPIDGGPLIEATLLIKEPEKTVTISESQFAQMAREIEYDSRLTTISSNHISARTKWFNRLFGSET